MPYERLNFKIHTSEPTKCKINFMPNVSYHFLPPIWFGEPHFNNTHEISFTLPVGLYVPKRLYTNLNITSLTELVDLVDDLNGAYEKFKRDFATEIDLYEKFTGKDLISMADPYVELGLTLIQPYIELMPYIKVFTKIILEQFEQNSYFLFIKCVDKAGNENVEDVYVRFSIDVDKVDTIPAKIIHAIPENNKQLKSGLEKFNLNIYLNEPAECKYSIEPNKYFNEMANNFDCAENYYQMSPVAGGTYLCSALVPFNNNSESTNYYVKCKDNPIVTDLYTIKTTLSNQFTVLGAEQSRYLNLSAGIIYADTYFLNENVEFKVNNEDVYLSIYVDDKTYCRFDKNKSKEIDEMKSSLNCYESNQPDIGTYRCDTIINKKNVTETHYIKCSDSSKQRNVNTNDYVLSFHQSKMLSPLKLYPETGKVINSPVNVAVLSEDEKELICGYSLKSGTEFIQMDEKAHNTFTKQLELDKGEHKLFFRCSDQVGNEIFSNTTFVVS